MEEWNLADLVRHGGVYHGVPGANVREVISGIADLLPSTLLADREKLCLEIMEREALISTGVGMGIALPHPRNPVLKEGERPLVAVAFPSQPVDWNTPDGGKVHTVFLLISSSVKQHLGTLSKINFLCQQEEFYSLISRKAGQEEIIAAIARAENAWASGY